MNEWPGNLSALGGTGAWGEEGQVGAINQLSRGGGRLAVVAVVDQSLGSTKPQRLPRPQPLLCPRKSIA